MVGITYWTSIITIAVSVREKNPIIYWSSADNKNHWLGMRMSRVNNFRAEDKICYSLEGENILRTQLGKHRNSYVYKCKWYKYPLTLFWMEPSQENFIATRMKRITISWPKLVEYTPNEHILTQLILRKLTGAEQLRLKAHWLLSANTV